MPAIKTEEVFLMQKLKKIDIHVHSVPERFLLQNGRLPSSLRERRNRKSSSKRSLLPIRNSRVR